MIIRLNLLSPAEKKNIRRERLFSFGNKIAAIVFYAAVIFSVLLPIARYTLQAQLDRITSEIYGNTYSLNQRINGINDLIHFVGDIQAGNRQWSPILAAIAANLPDRTKLIALEIDAAKKNISLRGTAGQRDSLLTLQKNLEQSGFFSAVNLPVQNLAKKENIDFIINADLR